MSWDYYYPKSTPRAAKGGVKSQSKRGSFAQSWWAKRWIQVLEGFDIGARLQRGRSYARSGQVLDIKIEKGSVTAKVQGSRAKPYSVRIAVNALSEADCVRLGSVLSEQIIYAAKLLAGEMPQDIEQLFAAAGLSLFPEGSRDLQTECSCPDWSNPCKHVAAVYYLIGEEFDRDPFLLFKLRGIDRERLLASLDGAETSGTEQELAPATDKTSGQPRARRKKASARPVAETSLSEPLSPDTNVFWHGSELSAYSAEQLQVPPIAAALPRRLGHFPFWRADQSLVEVIEPIYGSASARGLRMLSGENMNDVTDSE